MKAALFTLTLILFHLGGESLSAAPSPAPRLFLQFSVVALEREPREPDFAAPSAAFDPVPEIALVPDGAASLLSQLAAGDRSRQLWQESAPVAGEAEVRLLLGGEFPLPVFQFDAAGQRVSSAIVFKEYGVQIKCRVLERREGLVSLELITVVSHVDLARHINFASYVIPALNSRRTRKIVWVAAGQTLRLTNLLTPGELSAFGAAARSSPRETLFTRFFEYARSRRVPVELAILITPCWPAEEFGPVCVAPTEESGASRHPALSDADILGRSGFATSLAPDPKAP